MKFEDFIKELVLYKIPIEQEKKSLGTYFNYYSDRFRINGVLYNFTFSMWSSNKYISHIIEVEKHTFIKPEELLKRLTTNHARFGLNRHTTVTLVYNVEGRSRIILKRGTRSGPSKLYYSIKIPREETVLNDKIRISIQKNVLDDSIFDYLPKEVCAAFKD